MGTYEAQVDIFSQADGEIIGSDTIPVIIRVVDQSEGSYLPLILGGVTQPQPTPVNPPEQLCPENEPPPSNDNLATNLVLDGELSQANWYRTPITFTMNVTSTRPVTTQYRFTENPQPRQTSAWTTYTAPFTFALEGNQAIHYYSADDLGNVEPVQTTTFQIDLTTPVVQLSTDRLSRCDSELGYTIRDLVSGLREVEITVNGEPMDDNFSLLYLELGDHTVAITGTDYADWVTTFVAHIPLPADVAGIICTKHILFDLGEIYGPGVQGICNSLLAKLEAAQAAIERGQNNTAINQLNAFINQVNAQQASHITLAGAERMIADAEAIIAILQAEE